MSDNPVVNEFEKVGTEIKDAAETVAHDVVQVVEYPVKAAKVIAVITADYPVLKPVLETTLIKSKAALADGIAAAKANGLNWAEDKAVIAVIEDLADYFVATTIPATEKFYEDLNTAAS